MARTTECAVAFSNLAHHLVARGVLNAVVRVSALVQIKNADRPALEHQCGADHAHLVVMAQGVMAQRSLQRYSHNQYYVNVVEVFKPMLDDLEGERTARPCF